MDVLEQVLADAQPGYEEQVVLILNRWIRELGEPTFEGVDKADFAACVISACQRPGLNPMLALMFLGDLASLSWWAGVELGDAGLGELAAAARRIAYNATRQVAARLAPPDPDALTAHAVFVGALVSPLHSPTRGAFAYIHALTRDPANRRVDVYYSGNFNEEVRAYAAERLGEGLARARFVSVDKNPDFLADVINDGARTFHYWCERAYALHISLTALLGPTVMFTCGDIAPIQFADVYWFNHEAEVIQDRWGRQGAPQAFIDNYRHAQTAAFCGMVPQRRRTRAELGWREDEVVIVTAGNRLAVDMDQPFVDGLATLVMHAPATRWVICGQLPEYFVSAFSQVLGERFTHVPFDPDLMSLLANCDVFANPFRAGGGYTAAMTIEAGACVLTRADKGDVCTLVPRAHWIESEEAYFETLQSLVDHPALRAAWAAEQRALLMRQFDQDAFAEELKTLTALAYDRFCARLPATLEQIFAQVPPKRQALKASGRSARLR